MTPRKPFNENQFSLEYEKYPTYLAKKGTNEFKDEPEEVHSVKAFDATGRYGWQQLGSMQWHGSTGRILRIQVENDVTRKGLGTRLWQHANELAAQNTDIVAPKHSRDRTLSGELWARRVGGELPPNTNPRAVELADQLDRRFKKSKAPTQWEQLGPFLIDSDSD